MESRAHMSRVEEALCTVLAIAQHSTNIFLVEVSALNRALAFCSQAPHPKLTAVEESSSCCGKNKACVASLKHFNRWLDFFLSSTSMRTYEKPVSRQSRHPMMGEKNLKYWWVVLVLTTKINSKIYLPWIAFASTKSNFNLSTNAFVCTTLPCILVKSVTRMAIVWQISTLFQYLNTALNVPGVPWVGHSDSVRAWYHMKF